MLIKHLQTEFNTEENDIYILLKLKKEQLLNPRKK